MAAVQAGCYQDGLIKLGPRFAQEPGYKTAALFFDKAEVDYHFAVLEDSSSAPELVEPIWRSKVPREPFLRFEGIPEIAKESGYDFWGYYLVPEEINPQCFSGVDFTEIRFETGDGQSVVMEEALNPKEMRSEFASTFMLCPPAGLAFSLTEEWFYQMPPLPFDPNPVLAGDAIAVLNGAVKELAAKDNAREEELSHVTIWAAGLILRAIEDSASPGEIARHAGTTPSTLSPKKKQRRPVGPEGGSSNGGAFRKLDL